MLAGFRLFSVLYAVQSNQDGTFVVRYRLKCTRWKRTTRVEDLLIQQFRQEHALAEHFQPIALKWFIPLADKLVSHQTGAKKTFFVGINGCQGSGKTTLVQFLKTYFQQKHGLAVASLSLDDFYLDQHQRQKLSTQIHPLLKTRGVPGTHDTQLLADTLTLLASEEVKRVPLPVFDKGRDNPLPPESWPNVETPLAIVLMEGWCWGTEAQSPDELETPVNDLEKIEDPDGQWRQFVNQQLASCYATLYRKMDYWIMLKAPSFDCVQGWRQEQEQKLIRRRQSQQQSATMDEQKIGHFIKHFQRLTQHSLSRLPASCDRVLHLDTNRNITGITLRSDDDE